MSGMSIIQIEETVEDRWGLFRYINIFISLHKLEMEAFCLLD